MHAQLGSFHQLITFLPLLYKHGNTLPSALKASKIPTIFQKSLATVPKKRACTDLTDVPQVERERKAWNNVILPTQTRDI